MLIDLEHQDQESRLPEEEVVLAEYLVSATQLETVWLARIEA